MRTAVVADRTDGRERISRVLRAHGHQVDEWEYAAAEAAIRREAPQVLVFVLPECDGLSALRSVCAADPTGAVYVICIVDGDASARTATSCIAAGAHEAMRAPYSDEDLAVQVDIQTRLSAWALAQTAAPVRCKRTFHEARAWRFLGEVVTDDLEGMLGRPLRVSAIAGLEPVTTVRIATIPMILASEHLELGISILADARARAWLGETMLGEPTPSDAVIDDLLREIANVGGGAVKRAMLPEGIVLSTGIPYDTRAPVACPQGSRCWRVALDEHGTAVTVIAETKQRANRRVPARGLIEGMVVVDDVCNGAGLLLLSAGTRLTSTTAERLGRMLDAALVEVSAA